MVCLGNICINTLHKGDGDDDDNDNDDDDDDDDNNNNNNNNNPWSRVLLEKPTGSQRVKKFPGFYATRRFIAAIKITITMQRNSEVYPITT